jgi:hypothetical protein
MNKLCNRLWFSYIIISREVSSSPSSLSDLFLPSLLPSSKWSYILFRFVFWDVLPCKKLSTDVSEVRAASIIRASVDNYFTRQYIPEDKSELHTRRRENLKSHVLYPTCTKFQSI